MGLKKEILLGDKGKIVLSEDGGNATIELTAEVAAGGGDVAGFAKASVSAKIDLDGKHLVDAGFGLLESKFANNAIILGALKGLQALVDAELPKV